jgi:hypothetical protein
MFMVHLTLNLSSQYSGSYLNPGDDGAWLTGRITNADMLVRIAAHAGIERWAWLHWM